MQKGFKLGPLEALAISFFQTLKDQVVRTGDLVRVFGWSPNQERKVLSQLSRKGQAVRVRRGLYLAPNRMPAGGLWTPGDFLALSTLMNDARGIYQISGPNAFNRYGWTDQVPNRIYAYNNRLSGERQIGQVGLTLIEVGEERLGSTEEVISPDGQVAIYASRARAALDAVHDWSRFHTLPEAYTWIAREVARDNRFAAELVNDCVRYANQGTIRRIGAILEELQIPEPLLRRLERSLRPSSSFIAMVPDAPKRGTPGGKRTSGRWGVVYNHERWKNDPTLS